MSELSDDIARGCLPNGEPIESRWGTGEWSSQQEQQPEPDPYQEELDRLQSRIAELEAQLKAANNDAERLAKQLQNYADADDSANLENFGTFTEPYEYIKDVMELHRTRIAKERNGKEPWQIRGENDLRNFGYNEEEIAEIRNRVQEDLGLWKLTQKDSVEKSRNAANFIYKKKDIEMAKFVHKINVKQALAEGKPVPPEVLADYHWMPLPSSPNITRVEGG